MTKTKYAKKGKQTPNATENVKFKNKKVYQKVRNIHKLQSKETA